MGLNSDILKPKSRLVPRWLSVLIGLIWILSDITNKLFLDAILLCSFSFNIFDKRLHVRACTHAAWNAAKQSLFFSTKITFLHTFSAPARVRLSLLHSLPLLGPALIHTLDFARARTHTPLFFSLALPYTHTDCSRGVCRCVSWTASSARLVPCQCADSEFSTLSYEIRAGDIRAVQ